MTMPSLQSQVRQAEYKVEIATDKSKDEVEAAINTLLEKESLPWEHQRDTGPRKYDPARPYTRPVADRLAKRGLYRGDEFKVR